MDKNYIFFLFILTSLLFSAARILKQPRYYSKVAYPPPFKNQKSDGSVAQYELQVSLHKFAEIKGVLFSRLHIRLTTATYFYPASTVNSNGSADHGNSTKWIPWIYTPNLFEGRLLETTFAKISPDFFAISDNEAKTDYSSF